MNRTQEVVSALLNDGDEEARRALDVIAWCIAGVDQVHRENEIKMKARRPFEAEDEVLR